MKYYRTIDYDYTTNIWKCDDGYWYFWYARKWHPWGTVPPPYDGDMTKFGSNEKYKLPIEITEQEVFLELL
jgi:hypothetical protein